MTESGWFCGRADSGADTVMTLTIASRSDARFPELSWIPTAKRDVFGTLIDKQGKVL